MLTFAGYNILYKFIWTLICIILLILLTFVPVECLTLFRSLLLFLTDDCCIDVQVRAASACKYISGLCLGGGGAHRWSITGVGVEQGIAELVKAEGGVS